jgi:tetratricopeptide (TPR) repeat protein
VNDPTPAGLGTIVTGSPTGFTPRVGPTGFELLDIVGRGGMGVVHRALDFSLGREVAVKVLQDHFPANSEVAARFVEEARITGQLQHPGIPPVYQVGKFPDGRPFLAMKLVRGRTLEARLADGPFPDPLPVFEAVAQAVGFAHSQGVIHRDLKPANVMVGTFGEVQVMDWGLAKVLGERPRVSGPSSDTRLAATRSGALPDPALTEVGSAIGTPAYMPPEQANGHLDRVDRRSDVFGLGAVLCALLTGKPPFDGASAVSVRENAMRGNAGPALDRLDACGAPADVVALCKRCLALDPAERPADGDEVAKAVARIRAAADDRAKRAEQDKLAAEIRAAEQEKRRRVIRRAELAGALVLAIGAVGTSIGLLRANAARHDADAKRTEAEDARKALAVQHATAVAKESETASLFEFFQSQLVEAARPKDQFGGLGHDAKLRDALTASLGSIEKTFAGKPLVEARLRHALGVSFLKLGDVPQADAQAAVALRLLHGAYGANHESELPILKLKLDNALSSRRFPEVVTIGEPLIPRLRVTPGADHPDTLDACESLAFAYANVGRHDEAFALREDIVARKTAAFGPDHPGTLRSLTYLAISYTQQGRSKDAVRIHRDSFAKLTAKLGPDNPTVLSAANNLANDLDKAGELEEAFQLREDTVARRRAVFGDDHPATLLSMHNLTASYMRAGRYKEAAERGEEVVRLRTAKLGRDNDSTLRSIGNLAHCYDELGRHDAARPLWEETVDLLTKAHPAEHQDYVGASDRLARSLLLAGRTADAVARIDACLKRVEGRRIDVKKFEKLLDVRLRHFAKTGNTTECAATAAAWETRMSASADDLHTAACMWAVAGDGDRAVAWVAKAVAAGVERGEVEADDDLASLRDRPDFQKLTASLPYVRVLPPPRPAPQGTRP